MTEMRQILRTQDKTDWKDRTVRMFTERQIHNRHFPQAMDGEGTTYPMTEEMLAVPSLGKCVFKLQYRKFHRAQPDGVEGDLIFSYNVRQSQRDARAAEMTFRFKDHTRFDLVHRIVEPGLRGDGIGTDILKTAETWFADLARKQNIDVTLELTTHQPRVMNWIAENGYTPKQDHAETYREILEHPEHFKSRMELNAPDDKPRERIYRKGRLGLAVVITFEKHIPAHQGNLNS